MPLPVLAPRLLDIRHLFQRDIRKCTLHNGAHVGLLFKEYLIITEEDIPSHEIIGHEVLLPCKCNTRLPIIQIYEIHNTPVIVTPPPVRRPGPSSRRPIVPAERPQQPVPWPLFQTSDTLNINRSHAGDLGTNQLN